MYDDRPNSIHRAAGEFLGYIQHGVVVAQFITAGIMLGIAFLLLGYALLSAQVGPRAIGIWGIVLLGVVIFVALISGAIAAGLISQWCGDLRKARTRTTRTTRARARLLAGPGAPHVLDPAALQAEMKEVDAMKPMLNHVKAVFAAERAVRNTITNDNRLQPLEIAGVDEEQRLQDALERAANARADAMLDQVLGGLTSTLSTKIWSCILSFTLAATQLCFVGILLRRGGVIVHHICIPQGCTPATTTDAKACASMVACLSSIGINPSPSPFPCAGTNPNGTTLPQVDINSTVTCDGDSNVYCLNNASVIIANDSNVVTTLSALSISFSTGT